MAKIYTWIIQKYIYGQSSRSRSQCAHGIKTELFVKYPHCVPYKWCCKSECHCHCASIWLLLLFFYFFKIYFILDVAPVCKMSSTTTHTGQLYTTCWGSVGVSVKSIRSSNIIGCTSACQVRVTKGDSGLCFCPCVFWVLTNSLVCW